MIDFKLNVCPFSHISFGAASFCLLAISLPIERKHDFPDLTFTLAHIFRVYIYYPLAEVPGIAGDQM